MKKALNLILIYFITLIAGLSVGTILYSFYINVINFIAGTEIQFFAKKEIFDAFFYVSFGLLFFICPLIAYYKIRHPGGIPQLIAFIFLALMTWVILIPGILNLSTKYSKNSSTVVVNEKLSKGYFRQVDDEVYYFTKNFSRNSKGQYETNAIVIDTTDDGKVTNQSFVDTPGHPIHTAAEPYKEILVKNTFQKNDFPVSINFRNLISICNINIKKGLLPFIGFLTLGLVLSSVFALTNVFKWKLINTMLITTCTFLILVINSNPWLLPFKSLERKFYYNGFFRFLSKFGTEPILFFMNFVFALIFIITGILIFIIRWHKNKKRNR